MSELKNNQNWRYDLPAGLVVFLVALPLCLGIAVASGADPIAGLLAGIVGGTVVALTSGSELGVSGPAAGLVVIVLAGIQSLGYEAFLLAVFIAGVFQLIGGFAGFGSIAYLFPTSVIKGMLAGIGVLLILKQIPHALGYDRDPEGDWEFIQQDGHNTISEIYYAFMHHSEGAIIITVISLAILILWNRDFIKKNKVLGLIPGPLLVVVLGVVINALYQMFIPELVLDNAVETFVEDGKEITINNFHLVDIPVLTGWSDITSIIKFPDFSQISNLSVYGTAITLAIVASLESLLCSEATDKLDPQKRITNMNKELRAQGLGNMVAGMIGALPVTQVIVRSSANIASGARTRMAAFYHGLLLIGTIILIPGVLNLIPLASLAAILFMVGYKLANAKIFKEMFGLGASQFVPFVVTILAIVFTDLLMGVGLGFVVATLFAISKFFSNTRSVETEEDNEKVTIQLPENVTFLNKIQVLNRWNKIPENSSVLIDGSQTQTVDYDIIQLVANFKEKAPIKSIDLKVVNIPEPEVVSDH